MTKRNVIILPQAAVMVGHPVHKDSKRAARRLDTASRGVVFRFCFTMTIALTWFLLGPKDLSAASLATALLGAAVLSSILAMLLGEPFRSPKTLNRWDETLAYLGVAALVRTMS